MLMSVSHLPVLLHTADTIIIQLFPYLLRYLYQQDRVSFMMTHCQLVHTYAVCCSYTILLARSLQQRFTKVYCDLDLVQKYPSRSVKYSS